MILFVALKVTMVDGQQSSLPQVVSAFPAIQGVEQGARDRAWPSAEVLSAATPVTALSRS